MATSDPLADRYRTIRPPLATHTVAAGIDAYLVSVAEAIIDGQAVDIPHLGRLRMGAVGQVIFEAADSLRCPPARYAIYRVGAEHPQAYCATHAQASAVVRLLSGGQGWEIREEAA